MKLHELKSNKGSHRKGKRVGRGHGSGKGTYSARGIKGQGARSGFAKKPGFEGGRTPLIAQIPKKRGFKSLKERPEVVNLMDLEKNFKDGDNITKKELFEVGLVNDIKSKVKILGDGDLKKKLKVEADLYSKSAEEKIKKASGEVKKVEKKIAKQKAVKEKAK